MEVTDVNNSPDLLFVECYQTLREICEFQEHDLSSGYRRMRELLELLCRTQLGGSNLQLTDLSARINYTASAISLSIRDRNRLHTFRLTSNAILNHERLPARNEWLRDVKTLAFFIQTLSGIAIPSALKKHLPKSDSTFLAKPFEVSRTKRIRCSYVYKDDDFLYVLPNDRISDNCLKVRYGLEDVNREFNQTVDLLWNGVQLNLLEVGFDEEGIATPSFIILEPDYLLDISALAECFKEYGSHPLNYLYSRLQLPDTTQHMLLGNIVNLFLDEWIFSAADPDYLTCMKKAFQKYPIELASCEDLMDKDKESLFFSSAKLHFENIGKTVNQTFHESGYKLEKKDAVLEPSYLCEAMGIQGRLDYLQRDKSSLIELKSGKADEFSYAGHVLPKENNRAQMLLYQAMLEFTLGIDHRNIKPYLLYSRYPLLYSSSSSWSFVRRIMNVRNQIVANEYLIQLHNSVDFTAESLACLNPSTLNQRQLTNKLWMQYQAPAIARLSSRIQGLDDLSKTYFYRLYNFITKELYTSKSGNTVYDGHAGASSLWLSTLEEKLVAGELINQLRITGNHSADVYKPYIEFSIELSETATSYNPPNFRNGDSILIYECNCPSDNVLNKMIFKGNIEHISSKGLVIRLREPQHNSAVLPMDSAYAMEHDYIDTGYRSMFQGLAVFLDANKERRSLLLGERLPEFNAQSPSFHSAFENDFERVARKAGEAKDYFLLVGPPGTGKTSRAIKKMVETFYSQGKNLLLLAYTNRAVDELCKMLVSISPSVPFIRVGSELNCEKDYRAYLLENVLSCATSRIDVRQEIEKCSIFVGTLSTLSLRTEIFKLKTFDVAIIDEASQILEPQLLGLLCAKNRHGDNAIGKFIMVGDYKQLPAVLLQSADESEVHEENLRAHGLFNLKDSLFERLFRLATRKGITAVYDMLTKQARMHIEVARFSNQAFYGNMLQAVGLPHQHGDLTVVPSLINSPFKDIMRKRVAFIPSVAESSVYSDKQNHSEAEIAAKLAKAVFIQYSKQKAFDPNRTLGVITPYRNQIALIKREISTLGIFELTQITVDTVERFQGSERDVIIYSFCANRSYQLRFLSNLIEEDGVIIDRKLNVALTRAREQLFLTGVPPVLQQNSIYKALLDKISDGHIR